MSEKAALSAGAPPEPIPPNVAYPSYPPQQPMHHQPLMTHMPMPTDATHQMPPGPYDAQYQQQPGYPQPPPPYFDQPQQNFQYQQQQQQPQNNPHVIMQQPQLMQAVIMAPRVGPDPCALVCPSCHKQIVTRMEYETSTKTHVVAAICCLFICWPCAWLPYVMDSCKNANHYCPHCNAFVGSYDGF